MKALAIGKEISKYAEEDNTDIPASTVAPAVAPAAILPSATLHAGMPSTT